MFSHHKILFQETFSGLCISKTIREPCFENLLLGRGRLSRTLRACEYYCLLSYSTKKIFKSIGRPYCFGCEEKLRPDESIFSSNTYNPPILTRIKEYGF